MHLKLEFLSENLYVCCLDVYLSKSKRISLDDQYFIWILIIENQKNSTEIRLQNR